MKLVGQTQRSSLTYDLGIGGWHQQVGLGCRLRPGPRQPQLLQLHVVRRLAGAGDGQVGSGPRRPKVRQLQVGRWLVQRWASEPRRPVGVAGCRVEARPRRRVGGELASQVDGGSRRLVGYGRRDQGTTVGSTSSAASPSESDSGTAGSSSASALSALGGSGMGALLCVYRYSIPMSSPENRAAICRNQQFRADTLLIYT